MKNKTLKILKHLIKKPSFTIKDALEHGVSGQSLAYYAKKGELERLAPGIYSFPDDDELDPRWSDLIRIVVSVPNSVVCLISALKIYELTDEIPREIWIAIPHKMRAPEIPNCRFVRMRNFELGITSQLISGVKIPIFDRERTVVDSFRYLDKEVAIKALKILSKRGMNIKKISVYAKKLRVNISPFLLMVTT